MGFSTLRADHNPPFVVRRIMIRREPGWPMEHGSSFAPETSLGQGADRTPNAPTHGRTCTDLECAPYYGARLCQLPHVVQDLTTNRYGCIS
jgi:hypothetical protein